MEGHYAEQKGQLPLSWDIDVSILSSAPIMKQLGFALGLSVIFVVLLMFFIGLFSGDLNLNYLLFLGKLFFFLAATLAVLLLLALLLLMGNRYGYTFTLEAGGIGEAAGRRQRKRNAVINLSLVVAGIFSGRPGIAGAGILAGSRQKQYLRWNEIDEVAADPRRKRILLKKNRRVRMVIFCTAENYPFVSAVILEKIK